jgi:hypothetical protein
LDGANGNKMHIWYWKNISIFAKVSQVSDVAHGPLVYLYALIMKCKTNRYKFWCTRCAFRLIRSLPWCSIRKSWKSEKNVWNIQDWKIVINIMLTGQMNTNLGNYSIVEMLLYLKIIQVSNGYKREDMASTFTACTLYFSIVLWTVSQQYTSCVLKE